MKEVLRSWVNRPIWAMVWALGMGGCVYGGEPSQDERAWTDSVARREQAIIGGTAAVSNSNAVAIYSKGTGECIPFTDQKYWPHNDTNPLIYDYTDMWWPRPCSGRVIRRDGSTNYVLTARHCVTVNGAKDGPLIVSTSANPRLVSTSRLAPGVLDVDEVEDEGVVTMGTPVGVMSTVFFENHTTYGDLAIVRAVGNLEPTSPATRRGIVTVTADDVASLTNFTQLRTESYGRNVPGSCWGHEMSGAGVLRNGGVWALTTAYSNGFEHALTSGTGTTVTGGDSGGSIYVLNIAQGWTAIRDIGVHSGSAVGAGGPILFDFIQAGLGYVYLVDLTSMATEVVVGASGTDGSTVQQNFAESTANTRMTFNRSTGKLGLKSLCIRDEGSGSSVRLRACSSTQTAWNMSVLGQIKNRSTGRCLVRGASTPWTLRAEACTSSSTKWTFVGDNAL